MAASTAWLAAYIALHVPLCAYGAHRAWLQLGLLGGARPGPPPPLLAPPTVTVQLPLYNEAEVAARVIAAAGALRWPADKLEIQVLDDSTDETTAIAEVACATLRARGIAATVVHRDDRRGYKAGALADGLLVARGDAIAIFDADFVPPPDFLERTVPYIAAGAGMVQARWGHLNETQSLLTRLQAVLLDAHFVVEQPSRARQGRWFQFNGTAGVWSRSAIARAGGWHDDTLTEDLDLSYRAQLAGERFVYLTDLVAPAELPADLTAFKAQQHRWGKGMAQALRKCGPRILTARAPILTRVEALLHLSSALAWPLVAFVSVLLPVGLWARWMG
jgi:cellulose synthase/poly-beta-1,6-N-acetylglucosamine synthase-like glycosyltransferase